MRSVTPLDPLTISSISAKRASSGLSLARLRRHTIGDKVRLHIECRRLDESASTLSCADNAAVT